MFPSANDLLARASGSLVDEICGQHHAKSRLAESRATPELYCHITSGPPVNSHYGKKTSVDSTKSLGFPYMFLHMSILVLLIGHAQFSRDQLRKEHDGAIEGARLRESDRQGEGERGKEYEQTGKGCSTIQ